MKIIVTMMFLVVVFSLAGFTASQTDPWIVPEESAKMPNPVANDDASVKAGKNLWVQYCSSCHGKKGGGNGIKATSLKTPMYDMASSVFQNQTDGAIYYKTAEGRKEMPGYKAKLSGENDMWNLVNFMRSFKN